MSIADALGGHPADGAGNIVLGAVDGVITRDLTEKTKVGYLADLAGPH